MIAAIDFAKFNTWLESRGLEQDFINVNVERLFNTWVPIQVGIIALAYLASTVLAARLTPVLEDRLRHIQKQPRLLRVLVLLVRRMKWMVFALLLWFAAGTMSDLTRLSRSYLVMSAAGLVTAWIIISIAARLVRNHTLRNLFQYSAWSVAALYVLGILPAFTTFLDGAAFSFGGLRLSLLIVVKALVLFAFLFWLANLTAELIEQRLRADTSISPTAQVLFGKFIKTGLFLSAILVTLSASGIDLTSFAVFSGAIGIGIGFGLQKVASNLISGVIILLDKSIKPGDVISLGETFGWISSLQARYVSVVTRDGAEYLIPNETFVTDRVINWSHSNRKLRLEIKFGVSYDSDPHVVRKTVVAALRNLPRVTPAEPPVCHVVSFGDSSIDFVARFWILDPEEGLTNVRGTAFLAIWDAFKANGITIPYPHRDIFIREPKKTQVAASA